MPAGGPALLDGALSGELIEVPSDGPERQAQTWGEGGRRGWANLGDRLPDPLPGALPKTLRSGFGPVRTIGEAVASD